MMGILAVVNLLAILMLFPVGMRVLKDFTDQLKEGTDPPVFDPQKFSGSGYRSDRLGQEKMKGPIPT